MNPAPFSPRAIGVLARAAVRELLWGLPAASGELRKWRSRAVEIPDEAIRQCALGSLDHKRGNTHGAGMFWTLPCVRSLDLLRLLVTYQVMWDYLDSIGEYDSTTGTASARQLHLALVDALDPGRPIFDYYRYHSGCADGRDGGYLCALVHACRQYCLRLPSLREVRPLLAREAARVNVQAINHDPDAASREAALREWVVREFHAGNGRGYGLPADNDGGSDLPTDNNKGCKLPTCNGRASFEVEWFELAAAAGANIAIYALLALAAEPACDEEEVARVYRAYFPWAGTLATMLDSFVDEAEDVSTGEQCYVAYYPSRELATQITVRRLRRCLHEVGGLRNGSRHTLLVECMVAMYLSKDSANAEAMRATTSSFVNAGGPLAKTLLPILRLWRIAYAQRAT